MKGLSLPIELLILVVIAIIGLVILLYLMLAGYIPGANSIKNKEVAPNASNISKSVP